MCKCTWSKEDYHSHYSVNEGSECRFWEDERRKKEGIKPMSSGSKEVDSQGCGSGEWSEATEHKLVTFHVFTGSI